MCRRIVSYGLTQNDLSMLLKGLAQFPQIKQALIFGSRAKGTYRKGSDVDLAIKGEGITYKDVNTLSTLLNEQLPLPYFFDIAHYETIVNYALVTHIDRVGQIVYRNE